MDDDEIRKHRARHIIEAVCADVWAIHEPKLEQIVAFLNQRAVGVSLSAEQIKATMRAEESQSFAASLRRTSGREEEDGPLILDGVQVMQLYGTLGPRMNLMMEFSGGTSTQQFAAELAKASANEKVKTVLVEVDSPGGVVGGTEEARQAMLRFKQSGKRLVVVGRNMMASAAYYIGAAGSQVYASPSAEVGSVGVYAIIYTATKAIEEAGLKYYVFRAGDLKASGNAYEELTSERKAALQARVDAPYRMFVSAVAEDRQTTAERVMSDFGKGTVFLADEAARRGMIDGVKLIEDVFNEERTRNRQPVSVSFPAASAATITKGDRMNSKIKAALFARGLVDSMETSDEIAQAALNGYLTARGITATDDQSILAALMLTAPKAEEPKQHKEHEEADKEKAERAANARAADIFATGEAFGVSSAVVRQAVESGMSHEDFVREARKQKAAAEKPVDKVSVHETGSGAQRYMADALAGLEYRLAAPGSKPEINGDQRRMANRPLLVMAKDCLRMNGVKFDEDYSTNEDIASMAMSMAGPGRDVRLSERDTISPMAADGSAGPYNRPSMFPYLLANLANKFLDSAIQLAEPSYPDWTAVYPSGLSDFKPVPIVNKGVVDGMDEVLDAEVFREMTISEEMLSYMFLRRFGNKWGWTPVMIANDDLNAFAENMLGLGQGWEFTQNDLCLGLLTGNGALLDGVALIDNATHANTRASGNPPSDTEWAAMEVLYGDQTGIGTTRRVRGVLTTALVPTGAAHQAAMRTFETYPVIGESKVAATTANLGIYRGKVRVVPEPELRATSSAVWYGFRNPTQLPTATVVRAYFRGYGSGGRRETWYDPESKCTYVSIEGRIGVAAKSYRYIVHNAGTGAS